MPPKRAASAAKTKSKTVTEEENRKDVVEPPPEKKTRGAKKATPVEETTSQSEPSKTRGKKPKIEDEPKAVKTDAKVKARKEPKEKKAVGETKPKRGKAAAAAKKKIPTEEESENETEDVNGDPNKEEEEAPEKAEKAPVRRGAKRTAKEEKREDEPAAKAEKKSSRKATRKATKKQDSENEESLEADDKKVEEKPSKNATKSSWDEINFKCDRKSSDGKSSNFHIISWNVDGVRAWLKKDGLKILEQASPDILCIQETKVTEDKLPDELKSVNKYHPYWCHSKKEGYAGVGIFSKVMPIDVTYGINSEDHDEDGRCITAEFKHFYVVNVYVPNAGRKLVTLPKRLEWNKKFKEFIKKLDEKKPVIVCGDMNVAHQEIDLANPKTNKKNAGFTVEEREGMTDFLNDGYIDTFRKLYPDKEKAYTFWAFFANARARNIGWRLDYFIASERIQDKVCDNIIHDQVFGSDHCPLSLFLNI